MAWLRVEDTAHSHPAVLATGLGGDDRQVNEVLGWVVRCASWSAEHLQDGYVPEAVARQFAASRYPQLLRAARKARIVSRRAARDAAGQPGWHLEQGEDAVLHLRTKEEVELDRARRGTTRQQEARIAARLRDGDQCRYCQRTVDFDVRKGTRRGTYDHPDPTDRNTFVVSCGGCNQAKQKRTPEQWAAAGGLLLQDPPHHPHYTEKTAAWLADAGALPQRPDTPLVPDHAPTLAAPAADAHARPGSQPDPAAPGSTSTPASQAALDEAQPGGTAGPAGSGSVLDPSGSALPRQAPPGRVGTGTGSGQVGSTGPALSHPRDGPARRGRRGRRGRQPQPP